MLTVRDLIPGIRDWLGNPPKGTVSNTSILLGMYDELDNFRSSMNLANVGWSLSHYDLPVSGGKEQITIEGNVPLGNVVLVTTWDKNDEGFRADEIPVTTIQSQDKYYIGPRVDDNFNSASPHAAQVFTFTRDAESGDVVAIVKPSHQALAYYRIWFQPDRPEPPGLQDNLPFLNAFSNLLKVKVAIGRLPKLYKSEVRAERTVSNAEELKLLMGVLVKKEAEYQAVFEKTKQQMIPQQAGSRVGFNRWYDDGIDTGYYY